MSISEKKTWVVFLVVFLFALGSPYSHGQSDEELAKASQNPVGDLISLPLQNNTNAENFRGLCLKCARGKLTLTHSSSLQLK